MQHSIKNNDRFFNGFGWTLDQALDKKRNTTEINTVFADDTSRI